MKSIEPARYRGTYRSWYHMKQRCTNPLHAKYKDYGSRGITYDPAWESFEQFLTDMGLRPYKYSIERIDNDGPYCKANCRWATAKEQRANQRPAPRRAAS